MYEYYWMFLCYYKVKCCLVLHTKLEIITSAMTVKKLILLIIAADDTVVGAALVVVAGFGVVASVAGLGGAFVTAAKVVIDMLVNNFSVWELGVVFNVTLPDGKEMFVKEPMVAIGDPTVDVNLVVVAVVVSFALSSKKFVVDPADAKVTGTEVVVVMLENVVSILDTVGVFLENIVPNRVTVDIFLVVANSFGVVPIVLKMMVDRPGETVFCCLVVVLVGGCVVCTGIVFGVVVEFGKAAVAF